MFIEDNVHKQVKFAQLFQKFYLRLQYRRCLHHPVFRDNAVSPMLAFSRRLFLGEWMLMLLWSGLPPPMTTMTTTTTPTGREDEHSVDEARREGHQQPHLVMKRHSGPRGKQCGRSASV
jgi:hypothetical protein